MTQRTFTHATLDWGHGVEVTQQPKNSILFFEKAGEKVFVVAKALETNTLKAVTLPPDELAALLERAAGRKPRTSSTSAAAKKKKKAASKAVKAGAFATFAEQVKLFETIFPGGFAGEKFTAEGRETESLGLVQSLLSAKAFGAETPEKLFENAQSVLAATEIAHPVFEGKIPFKSIPEADRAATVAALKDVLHGTGDYGERLSRFALAINMRDKKGVQRKVAWPLVTVFGALFDPATHTAVKPTAFASQARTLGFDVDRSQKIDAGGYAKFLSVATKTRDALVAAGLQPKDLLDVYTFIQRTHAEKPEPVEAAAPGAAPTVS